MATLHTEAQQASNALVPAKVPGIGDIGKRIREIHDMIAQRAYALYEGHGHVDGHQQEDWMQAEAEVLAALCVGLMEQNNELIVDIAMTASDLPHIQVAIEPARLVISGRRHVNHKLIAERHVGRPAEIFRVDEFPVRVDPSEARARFGNGRLEFRIRKEREGHELCAARAA